MDGAPFVMPARTSMLAKSLIDWFRLQRIAPTIVAEIESPDLASEICETHTALFALPTTIALEVERKSRLAAVGEAPGVEQHFYLVSAVRPTSHESIPRIIENVRQQFRMPATVGALERVIGSWRSRELPELTTAESGAHVEECAV
jgi:LysR family transcriptional activator of nhaA